MKPKIQLSEVQDSILILSILAYSIEEYFRILKREHKDKSSIVYAAVSSQVLLQACSFKEEWKTFLSIRNERNRITEVGRRAQHFSRRINQWTDLEKVRNIFIAHNFRDKNNGNSNRLVNPHDRELNIPNEYPDYVILCGCIQYINDIVLGEFSVERNAIPDLLKNGKILRIKKGVTSVKDALKELQFIIDKRSVDK